ncbi:hypothetical protein E4U54_002279 [Claviceps lovelessii]|nr:hypothetical protein E4U54_002279 [Claviceps lovelessii]
MDLGPNRIVETRERDPGHWLAGAAPRPRPPATGRHSWTRDPGFPRYAGLSTVPDAWLSAQRSAQPLMFRIKRRAPGGADGTQKFEPIVHLSKRLPRRDQHRGPSKAQAVKTGSE